jgi:hypothetical protein
MRLFVALLRDSERIWTGALFCALCLVLAAGRPAGAGTGSFVVQAEVAALATLLAVWVARRSGSRRRGLAIALAAAFTTPLLPYAYAAGETLPALLLFAAGFLAIGPPAESASFAFPWREIVFLLVSGALLLADTGSLLLLPLLLWLAWRGCERRAASRRSDPRRSFAVAAAVLLPLGLYRVGSGAFWRGIPAALVDSPIEWMVNIHGFLLSLNKGLVLFAPLALIGLWRAFRGATIEPLAGRFALYAAASLVLPHAALVRWSDAAWGPRHLVAALAPALLALALSQSERARRGGHRRWILLAVGLGLAVNSLGTAIPQEALADIVRLPAEEELVALQFDPRFNHVRWNAAALTGWLRVAPMLASAGDAATVPGAVAVRPGPLLLGALDARERHRHLPMFWLYLAAGAAGWTLLILARHAAES